MAGGKGERFWPQSSAERPKHLLSIVGEEPMVAQAVGRLEGLVPPERIFIVTNARQVAAVQAACPTVPKDQVVGEPMGRDTGPAAALAALLVRARDPEGVLVLLPADAAIHDAAGCRATLHAAFLVAQAKDEIITVGVRPTQPATGYGYLRRGAQLGESEGQPWFRVERFVEKPDLATAQRYLADGGYLWNAGMFVARASVLEAAFRTHAPAIAKVMDIIEGALGTAPLSQRLDAAYGSMPKISLDYAVMEKAGNVAAFEAAFDWDDVGEWPALARHWPRDQEGNVARGAVVLEAAQDNIVISEGGQLVALLGVKDLVVVHTPGATLVCHKDSAQDLKKLLQKVAQAADAGREPKA
ncbi:MAG: sugar phosphate nucleotidyltransferase [Opitutales bacterium]|jgi:mannose-1-phosphate guanylyltransferase